MNWTKTSFILKIIAILGLCACSSIKNKNTISSVRGQAQLENLSPWGALQKLKMGNERFLHNSQQQRNLSAQIISAEKQHPFAIILSCMDSRGSPEIIFDQGVGDIFAERLAGNIINKDILGGMEFGTKLMGAKLVVVLGHTSCGAIKGACENAKLGNLSQLLSKIKPAVKHIEKITQNKNCEDPQLINQIAANNVVVALEQIKKESPVLMRLLKAKKIGLVGGMHDLSTGKVVFFDDKKTLPGAPKN